ncbi:MAG: YbaL family putative K(+) efflux transporter [Phenylobacterium sp.]|uniref:YbaL family putative K(+) efflux transporter n=1 Tax=Phenylobacterium sp. TaxID=1871053 RepID=UPI0027323651|nr:YbaL family putative K(+) efflux transporter [Phenylobacterium sp.]MDP3175337.1 YbaL family putative K(+) efflux transporter [Phenylobacterium sp.]
MPHHTPLLATIVAGLVTAFVLGAIAQRLRLSPLAGYLLAGVLVGPFTPGYVADQAIANELAEIGVVLLMFGVGLHFSLKDLLAVRKIAVPGAIVQMAVATALGAALGHALGWSWVAGVVFGLALSVASTVVLLRALQERRIVHTNRGHIAVGWLIVEDIAMVLALVLLPAMAGAISSGGDAGVMQTWIIPLAVTLAKVAAFAAVMLVVGARFIPWVLHYTAHTGSRELFRLAVLAIALGVAVGAAYLFGVSLALGAFFAGMVLAGSPLSQRAAEETLPLRDAFAVLFFVSVGMLFNPMVLVREPWPLLATVGVIVIGKSLAALAIIRTFGHSNQTALTIAASLAQIGEFSFILAGLGVGLGLLPPQGRDLILGGAIISILLNPLIFSLLFAHTNRAAAKAAAAAEDAAVDLVPTALSEHAVLVGFGVIGASVAESLREGAQAVVVIEVDEAAALRARAAGLEALEGNAADSQVLAAAGIKRATRLFVAIPDGFEGGQIVEQARRANAKLEIVACPRSDAEAQHLLAHGADRIVMGEREIAREMLAAVDTPSAPAPSATPDLPAQSVFAAPARERVILEDVERALLETLRTQDIWPGEALSRETLQGAAHGQGFAPPQVESALKMLLERAYVRDLGDGRVTFTKQGFLTAVQAAT